MVDRGGMESGPCELMYIFSEQQRDSLRLVTSLSGKKENTSIARDTMSSACANISSLENNIQKY